MSDSKHAIQPAAPQGQVPERLHPVVQLAMKGGTLDTNMLREVMQLQREWETNEAKKAFARALVALNRDLPKVIARDKTVDFQPRDKPRVHYTHASLAAAMEAVTPHLTAHGFALNWEPARAERGEVSVTCRLLHCEGHSESATLSAPADNGGGKGGPQAVASTVTMLQRYTALSLLGIATADMTDPEPREPDGPHINADRNLRAVGALQKYGRTREEAEAFLGREVRQWTSEDLDKLRGWLEQRVPGVEG